MKKISLTLVFILASLITFAQAFEGRIVYHNTFKSKTPGMSDVQFGTLMGTAQNYYIRGGNYKSETNGSLVQWQLYRAEDNKLYNKLANSAAILYTDGGMNNDEVMSSELHKDVITILGYRCDELVLNCKSGVQKYYFSSKLPVDANLYVNHKYGNWYAYLSRSNAVPLKMIIDNSQFTLESTASKIEQIPLSDGMFNLPPNVPVQQGNF